MNCFYMNNPKILICENNFVHFKYDHIQKILFVTVKPTIPTDKEWAFVKNTIKDYYEVAIKTKQKFSMMMDIRKLTNLHWEKYEDYRTFFNNLRSKTAICINGTAIITESLFIRAALNAFFAIYTAERPVSFVESIEAGKTFFQSI